MDISKLYRWADKVFAGTTDDEFINYIKEMMAAAPKFAAE